MNPAAQPSAPAASPALRSFEAQWLAREADSLSMLRARAMQRVLQLGLPTPRDESWRYTNLRQLAATRFIDAPQALGEVPSTAQALGLADQNAVVLVNGRPIHPVPGDSFESLEINSLKELSRTNPDLILGFLEPLPETERDRWALLNAALFDDGLYIKVTGAAQTLVIRHVLGARGPHEVAHARIIVDAAPGSSATIIEHFTDGVAGVESPAPGRVGSTGAASQSPLCNAVTHIAAGRDSTIDHYRIYSTGASGSHIDSLTIQQEAHSRCKQFTIALGGALIRTTLDARLNQAGAELDSYALLVGAQARHVDCVNVASHNARDTRSRQTARAIASGTSRVVFNSKVVVNAGAVHADSQQSCRGLLLGPSAEIDTRPQLEIHADEVKCAHGATVGRLDPDMLFYLLSRGLDRDTAQSLLVYAFLADVLTGMALPKAREAIESALIAQMPDAEILEKFR